MQASRPASTNRTSICGIVTLPGASGGPWERGIAVREGTCPYCGTPATGAADQRFCVRCGGVLSTPVAGVAASAPAPPLPSSLPPPPPHPPPAYPPPSPVESPGHRVGHAPRRRSVAGLVVLLVLALAAVGVGIAGALLLFGGSSDGDATASEGERSTAPQPIAPTSEAAADPAVLEPKEPKEQRFRCWDRTRAVELKGCKTDPEGIEGVYWLFPQAQGQACTQGQQSGREVFLTCTIGSSSGKKITINYTAWTTWDAAWAHYSGLDIQSSLSWPGMHGWYVEAHGDNAEYKAALLFRDAPFSVTVYGASADDRQAALDQLVVRPAKQLRGERIP